MSHTLTLTCPHCGHMFERTYGVNVVGQATLYCNKWILSKKVCKTQSFIFL